VSAADAYLVARIFEPEPERLFEVPHHYLLYAESGALRLEAEGRRWTLPPARSALIAAGHRVRIGLPRRVVACSALFAPGFVPDPPAMLSVFDVTPLTRELLLALRGVGAEDALDARSDALFRALAAEAWRLSRSPSPPPVPVPDDTRLRRALDLAEARLDGAVRLEEIAREVAMSPRSLSRHFVAETGMSWSDAVARLRLVQAVELMAATEAPITEVALAVGYASSSAFNAAFRRFTGQTPTSYRRGFRGGRHTA
jgi:AraC-like DNA-binding protein